MMRPLTTAFMALLLLLWLAELSKAHIAVSAVSTGKFTSEVSDSLSIGFAPRRLSETVARSAITSSSKLGASSEGSSGDSLIRSVQEHSCVPSTALFLSQTPIFGEPPL